GFAHRFAGGDDARLQGSGSQTGRQLDRRRVGQAGRCGRGTAGKETGVGVVQTVSRLPVIKEALIDSVRGEPGRTMNGIKPIKARITPLGAAQDKLRYAPDSATQGDRGNQAEVP